jgi:hypothetical protein
MTGNVKSLKSCYAFCDLAMVSQYIGMEVNNREEGGLT